MYAITRQIAKFFKVGMFDYCDLEAVEDKYTLVNKDGSLVTFLEVKGTFGIISEHNFNDCLELIIGRLSGVLKKPGYKLQFVFTRDPDNAYRPVEESVKGSVSTMKRLGLQVDEMLAERKEVLKSKTSIERCYLVLTTTTQSLTQAAGKQALEDRSAAVKEYGIGIKPGEFAQSPYVVLKAIKQTHHGYVESILNAFQESSTIVKLDVYQAIKALKLEISDEYTSPSWKPNLLGDKLPKRITKESPLIADVSHILNPSIAYQLFNQAPQVHEEDATVVKLGDKCIAPVLVDLPPQEPKAFMELFSAVADEVPWRWSFTVTTGHDDVVSKLGNKHTFASLLAFSSSQNRMIKEAAEELIALAESGEVLVSANMSLCTWGDNLKDVNRRKALLVQAVQGWGSTDVIEERGDVIQAWVNTLPGFSSSPISNTFAFTLYESLGMIPFNRPASPWDTGSLLLRTMDNKLYPYEAGSSKQTSWNDLVFAPPGYGKSFFLAAPNMGLILAPGNKILPRIAIIDIGFSSAAFVNMIKSCLPENKRDQAQAFKIEMNDKFAINPFDTPLGCRKPLAIDREFLINFVSLLLTPAGSKEGIPRLSELTSSLIDAMYDYFSETGNPSPYEPGVLPEVDKALEDSSVFIDSNTTWWDVVDELFKCKLYKEAALAQRFAVPTLNDATAVLSGDVSIGDVFGTALIGQEHLVDYIKGMIISVVKDYPIISVPSVFDIGTARIVSMDLSSVAKSGSDSANKKTGVMYMLARQILCREYYRNLDTLEEIPALYKDFHRKQIEEESECPKKICMDEFHRTHACQPVRDQAVVDIREGRKFNVHISLLSQMVEDFDDAMVKLANNIYILSKGITEDTVTTIEQKFGPSRDAIVALKRHVTGPGPEGSSMLYLGSLKGGMNSRVEQVLRLTLGPVEIWAYTTTHEDVQLRRKLVEKVGLNKALSILAKEFPRGAKDYIKSLGLIEEESSEQYEDSDNVYDKLSKDLIIKYKDLIETY